MDIKELETDLRLAKWYAECDYVIAAVDILRKHGFRVCEPNTIPIPRSRQEAETMNLISERYLKDNPT